MNLKNSKGITLVALVITIILLLLLAAITISSLRDSGLFGAAQNARSTTEMAQEIEELKLAVSSIITNNLANKGDFKIKFEDLEKELKNEERHPNVKDVKLVDSKSNTSTQVGSKEKLKKLFMPISLASSTEGKCAEVTFKSGRIYYIGVDENNSGKIFTDKETKIAKDTDKNKEPASTDDTNTEKQKNEEEINAEIEELKQAVIDARANMKNKYNVDIINITTMKEELNNIDKHPYIYSVTNYLTIKEDVNKVAKSKMNLKKIFIPISYAAVSEIERSGYVSVEFASTRRYYISCLEDESNGTIYDLKENHNTSLFTIEKISEIEDKINGSIKYFNSLEERNEEDEKYLEFFKNELKIIEENNLSDKYAITGLNDKGKAKVFLSEQNEFELNIQGDCDGKTICMIYDFSFESWEKEIVDKIKKVNIPDSIKIISLGAFEEFNPDTEFVYNKDSVYVLEEAFPSNVQQ